MKNLEEMTIEELVQEMQSFLPGYYIGCTLQIVHTISWNAEYLHKSFVSDSDIAHLRCIIFNWRNLDKTWQIDPNNTYYMNYSPDQLKVVSSKPEAEKTKEILVFGKYKIGDIVVSLDDRLHARKNGDLFKVLSDSNTVDLYYKSHYSSTNPDSWRAATPEEALAYNQGILNIKDIKPKEPDKVEACKKYLEQLPEPYRTAALSQMNVEYVNKKDFCQSIKDAVIRFNSWTDTSENYIFWSAVHRSYHEGTPLPSYPITTEKPALGAIIANPADIPDKYERCKYWLTFLPQPYQDMAITQMDRKYIESQGLVLNLQEAVYFFSNWDKTKESVSFWNSVYGAVIDPEKSYPPVPYETTTPIDSISITSGSSSYGTTLVNSGSCVYEDSIKSKKKSTNAELVSSFVTTQSTPKKKRVRLSIN